MEMKPHRAVNYRAELVGVFGYPVSENPTGVMQEAAFRELDLNWRYLTIEVEPEELADAFVGLKAFKMRGINLTIPHKVAVLPFLDEISAEARLMGAVNTVYREGNKLIGENTDGKGFMTALRTDASIDPAGKRVVLIGAGGAARAIATELALAKAKTLTIINRSPERGKSLVELLENRIGVDAHFTPWQEKHSIPPDTDILVNSTSIGLFPDIEESPDINYESIHSGMVVCDVIPNPPKTPFLRKADKRGAMTLDGLGMLVYQGAIGFRIWTGYEAPVRVMRQALEKEFAE